MTLYSIFSKWSQTSLVLRIFVGLIIGACLGLIVPQWTGISILGIVFFTATAEYYDRMKKQRKDIISS